MSRYLDIIRKKAEKGDPKFQHELAFEYFSGKKLKKVIIKQKRKIMSLLKRLEKTRVG